MQQNRLQQACMLSQGTAIIWQASCYCTPQQCILQQPWIKYTALQPTSGPPSSDRTRLLVPSQCWYPPKQQQYWALQPGC